MVGEWLTRTEILLGESALQKLAAARVYVFGLGAVGTYVVEGLARSGVGMMRLVDFDSFTPSNLNRQLYALRSTMGRAKAEVAAERLRDINPAMEVDVRQTFAHADTLPELLADDPDIIIDAIDSVNPKVEILAAAAGRNIATFSSMGAATRIDAGCIHFAPLFEATVCPLARVMRKRLRKREVNGDNLFCVYSNEESRADAVREPESGTNDEQNKCNRGRPRRVLGSLATVTGLFGLRLAHEAVLYLANK